MIVWLSSTFTSIAISIKKRLGQKKLRILRNIYWTLFGTAFFLTVSGIFLSYTLGVRAQSSAIDWSAQAINSIPALTAPQKIVYPDGSEVIIPQGTNPILSMRLPANLLNSSVSDVANKAGVPLDPTTIPIVQNALASGKELTAALNDPISSIASNPTFDGLGQNITQELSIASAFDIPANVPFTISHGLRENNPGEPKIIGGTISNRNFPCDDKSCSFVNAETANTDLKLAVSRDEAKGRSCTNFGCIPPTTDSQSMILTLENLGISLTKASGNNDNLILNLSPRFCYSASFITNCTDYLGTFPLYTFDPNSAVPLPITVGSTATTAALPSPLVNQSQAANNLPQTQSNRGFKPSPSIQATTPSTSINPANLSAAFQASGVPVTVEQINAAIKLTSGTPADVIQQILAGKSNPGAYNPTDPSNGIAKTTRILDAYVNIQT
jgi:hypothetical protein